MSILVQYALLIFILSTSLIFIILYYRNLKSITSKEAASSINDSTIPKKEKADNTGTNIEELYKKLLFKFSTENVNNKKTYNKNKQTLKKINQAYETKDLKTLESLIG